ncbi:hypothetical protein L9F63_002445, partial [Diploptera punctata]
KCTDGLSMESSRWIVPVTQVYIFIQMYRWLVGIDCSCTARAKILDYCSCTARIVPVTQAYIFIQMYRWLVTQAYIFIQILFLLFLNVQMACGLFLYGALFLLFLYGACKNAGLFEVWNFLARLFLWLVEMYRWLVGIDCSCTMACGYRLFLYGAWLIVPVTQAYIFIQMFKWL